MSEQSPKDQTTAEGSSEAAPTTLVDSHAAAGRQLHRLTAMRQNPEAIREVFETGTYPYQRKMQRKTYEKRKAELQVELLKVQDWVKATGQKIVILFEGRDAAGKGGTIKRFMEHLPSAGEIVLSTVPGTTAPASSASWGSARRTTIWSSCANARMSSA